MSTPDAGESWEPWDFKSVIEPEDLVPPASGPRPTGYSHERCDHPPTKDARAACRRERARAAITVHPDVLRSLDRNE